MKPRPSLVLVLLGLVSANCLAEEPPGGTVIERRATEFVALLADGEFEKATGNFDATMQRVLPANKLAETWNQVVSMHGTLQRQAGTRQEQVGIYRIVYVRCEFKKSPRDAKVVFDRQDKIAGLFVVPPRTWYQPPAYADPSHFVEREVTIGDDPWRLPGTLTIPQRTGSPAIDPAGAGPFPALVLVHGSGPNDRDESVGSNKPFKDLAWGLATRGFAVLRYEKRTKAHQAKMAAAAGGLTVKEETIDDALAAVEFLRADAAIDPRRIVVLGHSLGGYLIPRIAAADSDNRIAGYISLAGNTRSLQDLIWEQTNYLLKLDGSPSAADEAQLAALKKRIDRTTSESLATQSPATPIMGAGAAYWLDLRGYEPVAAGAKVKRPWFILQGERDYQVTMQDFRAWQSGLADQQNVCFKSYPKLNHLFVEGRGKSIPAEYLQAGNVSEKVIDDVAEWLRDVGR